ncbi:unnamed protein product [Ostreobium quekettii]|uniref:DUF1989 domain-containing protein n=1 Tax=Ostreobium quekettii TaxID=121088 RepID=A0A8S1IK85_9CHLO|nr:unnamed protein product [Ostreobium quekettii]
MSRARGPSSLLGLPWAPGAPGPPAVLPKAQMISRATNAAHSSRRLPSRWSVRNQPPLPPCRASGHPCLRPRCGTAAAAPRRLRSDRRLRQRHRERQIAPATASRIPRSTICDQANIMIARDRTSARQLRVRVHEERSASAVDWRRWFRREQTSTIRSARSFLGSPSCAYIRTPPAQLRHSLPQLPRSTGTTQQYCCHLLYCTVLYTYCTVQYVATFFDFQAFALRMSPLTTGTTGRRLPFSLFPKVFPGFSLFPHVFPGFFSFFPGFSRPFLFLTWFVGCLGIERGTSMARPPSNAPPADAAQRRRAPPVAVYADHLPPFDSAFYDHARRDTTLLAEIHVPPRDATAFHVPMGHFFRIVCTQGPQVGDLNLWNAADLSERFYSGKTRALHATHVTAGDRLWSSLPALRPMATITRDSLDWYGWDDDGAGVHDVVGTRCDPYTKFLLDGVDYHRCCHSNLTRALAKHLGIPAAQAEPRIHDVLNVFMCTGFSRDAHRYFMKASPARAGDFIEFFAEIDLIAALSACAGGDCGAGHSDDGARCYPLRVEVHQPREGALDGWRPPPLNGYGGGHGAT